MKKKIKRGEFRGEWKKIKKEKEGFRCWRQIKQENKKEKNPGSGGKK